MNDEQKQMRIMFTKHAKERLKEMGLEYKKVYGMIRHGEQEDPHFHKGQREAKVKKHGEYEGIFYIRNGPNLFTCKQTENKFKPEEQIILLITATDQRSTLRRVPVMKEDFSWGDA